ncbi:phytanoyl-CoA dioxygenase family protein [Acrocarpospora catenulata]|uniref:phytanoyl-CoA dioxygenase family protein n=1 Tax=Acrocarpospora catenulata TaxID=2836182 RepID=UPI001BD98F5A|nr:phytanoyl-CoA dioxygenase family protein [Acrocarpospora catenulata]
MIDFYQENGYLLVKGLLTKEEAAAYRAECHALLARLRPVDPTWGSARALTPTATELRHCHDAQFCSAAFARLMLDPRFTDVAAAVMGTENVQLHHTKIFVKPPEKGSPFPMHQDAAHFPHTRHTLGAAIFHLDDAPLEKGCVRLLPGSHKQGPLPHIEEGGWHLPLADWPLEAAVPIEAEAGDVLFFNYLTVHGSGLNTSPEARTTFLVQFRDPEDLPADDVHRSRGQGMMLRGVDPTARG